MDLVPQVTALGEKGQEVDLGVSRPASPVGWSRLCPLPTPEMVCGVRIQVTVLSTLREFWF